MRVAVLRGGPSNEYEESLSSGEQILNILRSQPGKYEPLDIFIDKNGQWHRAGVAIAPEKVLQHVDVVFNALHGRYGEDGQVQRLLVAHGIPYTGSGHINSALSRQPHLARQNLVKAGLRVPRHKVLDGDVSLELVRKIFRAYMHPIIVSPVVNGTAYDKRVVMSFQELAEAIAEAFRHSSQVMVEEAVRGKEVNCGILEKMRGQDTYALLPCPQQTNLAQNRKIEGMARQAHQSLGLKHYSMSKFVITPQGNIYIIDTRPHPPLHKDSPFIESLHSVGISPRDCVTHLINLAIKN